MPNATEINRAYYGRLTVGRENYWKLMPAPRMRIRHVVEVIQQNQPGGRSLCDFGCGNGDLLSALATRFPETKLYGIDLSGEQIRQNAVAQTAVEWAVGDLTAASYRYPFERPCEVAVSCEVIEHLTEPLAYLKNIHASLATNGLLVLTTQSGPVRSTERFVGHVRHWEANEMRSLLHAAGFREAFVGNCGFPFHDLSKWLANLRPEETMRRFGEQEWGPAQKGTAALLRLLFRLNSASRGSQLVAYAHKRG